MLAEFDFKREENPWLKACREFKLPDNYGEQTKNKKSVEDEEYAEYYDAQLFAVKQDNHEDDDKDDDDDEGSNPL